MYTSSFVPEWESNAWSLHWFSEYHTLGNPTLGKFLVWGKRGKNRCTWLTGNQPNMCESARNRYRCEGKQV